jgi:hypothetical protein
MPNITAAGLQDGTLTLTGRSPAGEEIGNPDAAREEYGHRSTARQAGDGGPAGDALEGCGQAARLDGCRAV